MIGKAARVCIYTLMAVLFGMGDSIGFFEMGQKMPDYPLFLLYFPTILYVTIYLIWASFNIAVDTRRTRSFSSALIAKEHQSLVSRRRILHMT